MPNHRNPNWKYLHRNSEKSARSQLDLCVVIFRTRLVLYRVQCTYSHQNGDNQYKYSGQGWYSVYYSVVNMVIWLLLQFWRSTANWKAGSAQQATGFHLHLRHHCHCHHRRRQHQQATGFHRSHPHCILTSPVAPRIRSRIPDPASNPVSPKSPQDKTPSTVS